MCMYKYQCNTCKKCFYINSNVFNSISQLCNGIENTLRRQLHSKKIIYLPVGNILTMIAKCCNKPSLKLQY